MVSHEQPVSIQGIEKRTVVSEGDVIKPKNSTVVGTAVVIMSPCADKQLIRTIVVHVADGNLFSKIGC